MATFFSPRYPSLIIPGAGQFQDGTLEVDGAAADTVRQVIAGNKFGITEDTAAPAPAPAEDDTPAPSAPKPRDPKPAWFEYAQAIGVVEPDEEIDDYTKDDLLVLAGAAGETDDD